MALHYSAIYDCDIANGKGFRVALFVSGCSLHCKGCFNQRAWDFCAGKPYTQETEDKIIGLLKRDYIKGLSILGGNPTEPQNEPELIKLCQRIRKELPDKDIWLWTGHTMKELEDRNDELVKLCDVVVDGRFEEDKKDLSLAFKGSTNQRILVNAKYAYYDGEPLSDEPFFPLVDMS